MSVPIATSPGRSGFGPQLSLSYDSGAGNGPFGSGWSLPPRSITCKTDAGLPKCRDTKKFAALASGQTPAGANIDASSHVPLVLAHAWFHTDVYLGRNHISNFSAGFVDTNDIGKYYREADLSDAQARALLLDDTVLLEGLTAEEEREACRTVKGSMLCQEVYAQERTDEAQHPYTVIEQNFTVRKLQSRGSNHHGAFFTHARESIRYHYKCNLADLRIGRALTLEVDDYGSVLVQAAMGYGRRAALLPKPWDRNWQMATVLTHAENRLTNAIESPDTHRKASEIRVSLHLLLVANHVRQAERWHVDKEVSIFFGCVSENGDRRNWAS